MTDRAVTLNVGGTFFTSKLSTLTRYTHSKLACKVVESETRGINDGSSLFIDRDPTLFRIILNCLRLGRVLLPDNFNEMELLKNEMAYFELYDLTSQLSRAYPETSTDVGHTSRLAGASHVPSRNGQDFLFVRCQLHLRTVYSEWVFESTESICQEIARALTGRSQQLEKPKHIMRGSAYRHTGGIDVAIYSQMMADLGFAESSRFDYTDNSRLKLCRMNIRPR